MTDIIFLVNRGSRFLNGSFITLLNNRSLKSRLSGVGKLSLLKLKKYGISGIVARASGLVLDLRIYGNCLYSHNYKFLNIKSFIGQYGDSFDRFILRVKEVFESFKVILSCLNATEFKFISNKKKYLSMEDIITHFKTTTYMNSEFKANLVSFVESPKGLMGVSIVNNSNYIPYRVQVLSPVARNMNLIQSISTNTTFADFVATFCSLDIVLGEIDR